MRLLLRQWIVVVLGGLLTAGAAAYLYTSTPPSYRATAQLLLLLPSTAGDPEERNSAFLYLPSELNILARVVASVPAGRDFAADLAARGLTSSYEVGVEPASPVIAVGVEGGDPDNVLATRDGLVEEVSDELGRVQREERVPSDQTARIRVFAAETTPVELGGSGLRAVIAVLAAGGLLTLLTAFATDWLVEVRRRRRAARSAPPIPSSSASSPVAATAAASPAAPAPIPPNGSVRTNGSASRKQPATGAAPGKRAPSKKSSPRATPRKPSSTERAPRGRAPSAGDEALASARGADRP